MMMMIFFFIYLAFPFCFVTHSSSSYPTNEPHTDPSTGAWNRPPPININTINKQQQKKKQILIKSAMPATSPCNAPKNGASLRGRVSRDTLPSPLDLGHTATIVVSTITSGFLALLWGLGHESQGEKW